MLKHFADCDTEDFTVGGVEYTETYFDDTIIITGHNPTDMIDEKLNGKIWRGNHQIAMDCGAARGNPLGCICLETGKEFYIE